jgi:4-amino-4-deoxy-L-arabinose transferase-like glycosyltransferase
MSGVEAGDAPATRPAPADWRARAPWIGIVAVALLARLAFVAISPPRILWADGVEYEQIGRSLVEHGSYGLQTLRAPGYPTLIAAVYAVFGRNLLALRLTEAVLGALAVGLMGGIGARAFGRTAGLICGGFAALHPVLAFLPSTQYSENTLLVATALAFGALFAAWRRGGLWRWAAGGLWFGVATLIRPNAVMMVPGLAAGLALAMRRERRAWLGPALVCAAAFALTLAPWTLRNHRVFGQWYFVATGGGRAFWLGNSPGARTETRIMPKFDSRTAATVDRLPNEPARERFLYHEGLRFMRENPGRAAQLYVGELGILFALWPETHTQLYVNPWSRAAQGLASVIIFAGALMALARIAKVPALWPLAGALATYSLGGAFFYSAMRYRLAVEPCLLWMAGFGWAWVLSRWARAPR